MSDATSPDQSAKTAKKVSRNTALERLPRFAGKTVLVTGGSDRGIGGAIAERFAEESAKVVIASRHEPKRLLKKLGRLDADPLFNACDVTEPTQVRAAVEASIEKYGRIDVLVNNAGVEMARPFDQFDDNQWRNMMQINLIGAMDVARACLPHLLKTGGVIVNIASALGIGGCSGFTVYSASKAGLIGWTQSLAWELAPRGVRVVGVAPGMVHTPMIHKHVSHLSEAVLGKIETCHPLGMGLPRDVAAAVAFLASEDARWITGVTLPLGWAPQFPLPVEPFMEE